VSNLIDASEESAALTQVDEVPREKSVFSLAASISLSGGRHPCAALQCRFDRVDHLARFSALYSERTFINNFLADHSRHGGDGNASVRQGFADDVEVLASIRPLVEAGIIVPITHPNYCIHCLTKDSLGKDADERLNAAAEALHDRMKRELRGELQFDGHEYDVGVRGPEDLIEHGSAVIAYGAAPAELRRYKGLLAKAQRKKSAPLTQEQCELIELHERFSGEVMENVRFDLASTHALGTTFVTERDIHVSILNAVSQDNSIQERNRLAFEHLTSVVPFAEDVDIANLVQLRDREQESFVRYRRALVEAMQEHRKAGQSMREQDARAVYSDIIAPELARLDQKVAEGKRDLIRHTSRTTAAWVAAISFGSYTGFLPAGVVAAASALGLTKVVADLVKASLDKSDQESALRSEEMYFLWKARKLSR
jgi:hypothetical protein